MSAAQNSKLPREFYTRPNVLTVARQLLGKLLVVPAADGSLVSGIIVETEAYRGPQDRASHAYGGRRTNRTETMYGIGGTAYVYFVYGMYYQFNVVTNVENRSEEHTSELQSRGHLVCRLLLEKKKK